MNFITEMLDLFYAIKHLYKKIGGVDEHTYSKRNNANAEKLREVYLHGIEYVPHDPTVDGHGYGE